MDAVSLVAAGPGRYALTGLELPPRLPTRIFISGSQYRLVQPSVSLPPLANTMKAIVNWALPAGRIAKNIWYIKSDPTVVTSDPAVLLAIANDVAALFGSGSGAATNIGGGAYMNNVTVKDNAGSTAQATSGNAPVGGTGTGCLPPQCAVCLSWQQGYSYRGGKPRTYWPAIPTTALVTQGGSTVTPTFAQALRAVGEYILTGINGTIPASGSHPLEMGTVSYHVNNAPRVTPLWIPFQGVEVHERLDSQRRRSGKEALFAEFP